MRVSVALALAGIAAAACADVDDASKLVDSVRKDRGDGWQSASPEAVGRPSEPLRSMTEAIDRGDYRNVHALLIAKDGQLVCEEYFEGTDRRPESGDYDATVTHVFGPDDLHTTRSAGKSFTSAVLGVALEEGKIASLDESITDLLPEYAGAPNTNVSAITLRHLLTMTEGLDWDQASLPYSDPSNPETAMYASAEPERFVLSQPVAHAPGERWNYNSGTSVLIGSVLSRSTGEDFASYLETRLFAPLGITRFDWTSTDSWRDHPAFSWEGREPWEFERSANPSGSLWLVPRDMLKIGQLFANGGSWDGVRVLPEEWVELSLAPLVPRAAGPTVYENGTVHHEAYGLQWWHDRFELPWGEVTVHAAFGNGGQRIWLLPEYGVVAVHLAGNYSLRGHPREADRLLLEHIAPWAAGVTTNYRHQTAFRPTRVEADDWPVTPLSPEEQILYVGNYLSGNTPLQVQVFGDGIRLLPPLGYGPIDLVPTDRHTFAQAIVEQGQVTDLYFPDDRLVFVPDDDGRIIRVDVTAGGEVVDTWPRVPGM